MLLRVSGCTLSLGVKDMPPCVMVEQGQTKSDKGRKEEKGEKGKGR